MDWALYREALILEEAGKLEEALLALKKLVGKSSDPVEDVLPYLEIANSLRGLGRHGEAREYLRKAYETLGENHKYYLNVMFIEASIEEEVGNYDKGLEKLDSIFKSFPDFLTNPEYEDLASKVKCLRGVLLAETKKYKEAKPLLEAAISIDFSRERILFYLGVSCCQLGYLAEAIRYLTEALDTDLNPEYKLYVHYYLGLAHLWRGNNAWAKQEFEWCLSHIGEGRLRRDHVLSGLVKTSEALGLQEDAKRYSAMT